ncbi:SDR family oxidoreductase [Amycolatopsis acidicola]|uniref:SDR family oxidoreductase n=1 Tax=Amycolatopsis acidicola TaxID=2596893 RepID=A0A5N0UQE3_9PSEU|nr:SDR family NAD(P)-dependent oxidoreductase [Amycolatopsis acidicola]KAA9150358.1 SDR family oxidoreductase [Amycolatopsis acidicola]
MLDGQVAIVTGSSRGIGRAVAFSLAAQGAKVVVNGRDADTARRTADDIGKTGGEAVAVAGSAADPDVAEQLLSVALDRLGPVRILVNCAGTAEPQGSSILSVTRRDWDDLMEAHLDSAFETCRVVAPYLVEQGGGAIVNTGSHAFTGIYGGTGYPAGKGGVNGLTLAIAAELREHHVRANVVCPGARTRLSTGEDYEAHIEELHRRGLLDDLSRAGSLDPGPPEYVAELYTYLVTDLARDITGQIFAGSGCYVGKFPEPEAQLLTWRDHAANPPWSLDELHAFLAGN